VGEWILTDDAFYQHRKLISDEPGHECFNLVEIDEVVPPDGEDLPPYFKISFAAIDLSDYPLGDKYTERILNSYSYGSFDELLEAVGGDKLEAAGQLAEMVFELECPEYVQTTARTWEEAVRRADEIMKEETS
jgi:hypothetical protein